MSCAHCIKCVGSGLAMLVFIGGMVTDHSIKIAQRSAAHVYTCPHTDVQGSFMIHRALSLVLQCIICIVRQIKLVSANPAYTHYYFLCTALQVHL